MTVLRDQRLILRPMNRRDRRFYARVYTDPVLMAQIGPTLTRATALRCATAAVASRSTGLVGKPVTWVVRSRPVGERIGLVGWRQWGETLELGVILLARWQGHGAAEQALRLLCDAASARLDVAKLVLRHRSGHMAMATVARRLGFQPMDTSLEPAAWRTWQLTKRRVSSDTAGHDEVS